MKSSLLLLILLVLGISCNKKEEKPEVSQQLPTEIKISEPKGMLINVYDTVFTIARNSNANCSIDINNDGRDDIAIECDDEEYNCGIPRLTLNCLAEDVELLGSNTNDSIYISNESYSYNDTLYENLIYTCIHSDNQFEQIEVSFKASPLDRDFIIRQENIFKSGTIDLMTSGRILISESIEGNPVRVQRYFREFNCLSYPYEKRVYFGVRIANKLGWFCMSVFRYSTVTIYDSGIQE